jgi:hypothetical protein
MTCPNTLIADFAPRYRAVNLALIECVRALAEFSRQAGSKNISSEAEGEGDWRAAGQKVTFCFAEALDRDLFKNEVRRLLPADLVRFDGEGDNGLAIESPLRVDRNNPT